MHTPAAQSLSVGPLVTLRLPEERDHAPLVATLHEPEVATWWVGYTPDRVQAEMIDAPDITRIIEVEGQTAGMLYVIRGSDPEYPTTVIHLFLATRFRGRRIGEEALALAIRGEFADGITRITLDPNAKNLGAIRSYERLGFRPIGILRDYQVRPDGSLDDALFMDLTRRDFPDGPPLPVRE
ncbi:MULTISPECIES: GNAT family N-acetyltransferase [unclassified Leucobacter]|uniref:GNAT family N-acetyltransferase n=1 Tax=unclassified Leucobacter TaxID=2621730 RepID=UPI00165D313D|nr:MULTISPECIES: GNAT family protein [unclassified Leucobacter]MBC9926117.1 GNAT family N-acetyltransferase [Leucobacter sp. cx-169]MBC9935773.1 GNAT family N-acetyltransferase [Leucobacter sp. cx-87]